MIYITRKCSAKSIYWWSSRITLVFTTCINILTNINIFFFLIFQTSSIMILKLVVNHSFIYRMIIDWTSRLFQLLHPNFTNSDHFPHCSHQSPSTTKRNLPCKLKQPPIALLIVDHRYHTPLIHYTTLQHNTHIEYVHPQCCNCKMNPYYVGQS